MQVFNETQSKMKTIESEPWPESLQQGGLTL